MRYLMLIGFIFLNMVVYTQAMRSRVNYPQDQILRNLMLLHAVVLTDFVQDNPPKQCHLQDQHNKKAFVKIFPCVQDKKKYATEKRLLAPRNKPRNNKKSNK